MAPIRVMLVDDSPFFVGTLRAAISREVNMEVVATASNGLEALERVATAKPDVIVCDVEMPKMNGIEFLQTLLPKHRIPVVVISSTPGVTFKALQAGAVDFIAKPTSSETNADFFRRVAQTIRTAASANMGAKMALHPSRPQPAVTLARAPSDVIVAIGASTGGTDAIVSVVRDLPADFPPVLITQHMPEGFTAMYASRLDRECNMHVEEAKDGQRVRQGLMILAAGAKQMRLQRDTQGYYVSSKPGEKVNGHCPSVEVLFESVAALAGARSVGIILTGMGGDGAEGLLKMRRAGAYTIGQDKESSIVYGMPMVAFKKGAVVKQLPLDSITGDLIAHLNKMR